MAFWGVQLKPGKPYTVAGSTDTRRRLRISQATLAPGAIVSEAMKEGIVLLQCNVGNKSPVYLCALSYEKLPSCSVNVELEEEEDVVFSVIGSSTVHLTGYYMSRMNGQDNESESFGEDIKETETDNSTHNEEDKYEDSFIDDDDEPEVFSPSPISSDEVTNLKRNATSKKVRKRLKKRFQGRKRLILSDVESDNPPHETDEITLVKSQEQFSEQENHVKNNDSIFNSNAVQSPKNSKKSKKRKTHETEDATTTLVADDTCSSKLIIEVLETGKPEGKFAVSGTKVHLKYVFSVKENKEVFDLSVDGVPLKFRLGKGKVIKGLEMAVEGMRVGEKRRVTIPPSLGFGREGNGDAVPPNSWLIYEIELLKVR